MATYTRIVEANQPIGGITLGQAVKKLLQISLMFVKDKQYIFAFKEVIKYADVYLYSSC